MNAHAAPHPPEPHDIRTDNAAGPGATVGIQASIVHHANVYQISPDDPPEKKFAMGVKYLDDGVPRKAEELFSAAVAHGLDTAEVRFHWALSMFSARSDRDLTTDERVRLMDTAERFVAYENDEDYGPALGAIRELIVHRLRPPTEGVELAEKQILALPEAIREKALRHLDKVLSAATKDQVWAGVRERAEADRFSADRRNRVWAYFQPVPIPPRHRDAIPEQTDPRARRKVATFAVLSSFAAGYIGWLSVISADPVAVVAYVLSVAAAYVATRDAFDWRYRVNRIRWAEHRRRGPSTVADRQGQGFTAQVRRSFDFYFAKYRPYGVETDWWLAETSGIRAYLQEEITPLYREARVPAERIGWLVRYHAIDVQKRWRAGTLDDHRTRYHVADKTKIRCVLGLTILVLTWATVVQTAIQAAPIAAAISAVVVVTGGLYTARNWYGIVSERRRHLDDADEIQQRDKDRVAEFQRWTQKLKDARPSEDEMEKWLRSDTTILIADALEHFRISWLDVISYAVLRVPARSSISGREKRGPLRYDRYALRLFLITEDGVREVSKELNFRTAEFDGEERNTFRFDAVSSVNVVKGSDGRQNLRLTLTNGPTRDILVIKGPDSEFYEYDMGNPERPDLDPVAESDNPLDTSLDTTGFAPTLRILEGIAADGKNWIARGNY